jgi:hypothetical protein
MGHVFDWGHELYQEYLPSWHDGAPPPIPARRWGRTVGELLRTAGAHGLWFSGFVALPFDVLRYPSPSHAWRTRALFAREYRRTGLSWDVNVEARAAGLALRRGWAQAIHPAAATEIRRVWLLDPGYERAVLLEVRRLVPRYRRLPYANAFTGSDEPIALLPPAGSALARRVAGALRAESGFALPSASGPPGRNAGLRWIAYTRFVQNRLVAFKARESRLVHRIDPQARFIPSDFLFLDGFMPWDYSRFAAAADELEADPYAGRLERLDPGRGRYNPGFTAKLLSDLTGRRVRIILQAFPYWGLRPTPRTLADWSAQALRAGATDISFYATGSPRLSEPSLYRASLALAARLRATRLPDPPRDPATVLLYASASEGQGQPAAVGEARYRTRADALYTAYALLGERDHAAFVFRSDGQLLRDPNLLAAARIIWVARADVLDGALVRELIGWVRRGGTLVVADPEAFRHTPSGASLAWARRRLVGARLLERRPARAVVVRAGALGGGFPSQPLRIRVRGDGRHAFVGAGFTRVASYANGGAAMILRDVGRGRVLAFAQAVLRPAELRGRDGLAAFMAAVERTYGGRLDDPAWSYRVPRG